MARQQAFFVTGDSHLNAMLNRLKSTQARKAIRQAARPALKPVLAAAKRNAPRKTGELSKSLRIRAIRRTRKGVGMRVTTDKAWFAGDTFYGGFQEWGWKSTRSQIPGTRFLTRAALDKKRSALTIYRHRLRRVIMRIARTGK